MTLARRRTPADVPDEPGTHTTAVPRAGSGRVAAVAILFLVVAATHLAVSGQPLGAIAGLLDGTVNGQAEKIVWELGVPRLLTALLTGAAMGVSGFVLQATLRNPLAAPEFSGVNPGAVLGILGGLTLGLFPADSAAGALLAALAGGALGGGITWLLSAHRDPANLVVHGLLGSALLAGLTTMLLAYQPSRFGNALRWLIGSVDGRVWEHLAVASWWIAGGIAVAWACSGMLAVLSPSDDHAASLGLHPGLGRAVALTVAIALTAGAASLSGAIAFVGLVTPHVARRLGGGVLTAAVAGAIALAGADTLAQLAGHLLNGTHRLGVPTGVITALAGSAILIRLGRSQ
ncbi:iron ABC transporter permease [Nonomuraea turkmeniaca]|uniref:Iron ABC transporter permease n=1 Tax=Nonomuraea turkmeniaca TaxID=103838 RepID=A0A5S4FVG9_9ACTN|nr:iron chelate uptake ABC transporter family permease subunit [Nonomuraea turkmeniaca]TMR24777.1 iron ABC transporter permease [Nonomuraea turkmeniaca]